MLKCNIIVSWLFESHGMFSVSNVLGKEGQGVYILMSGLDIERTLGSAGPLGWASFWIFNLDIYMLCLVSARNVLDKENKGVYVLMSGLDIERVFASSGCVGWELIYDQFTVIVNWRYYRYLHFNYARIQWMLMRRFCGFDQNHLILLEDINKSLQFMIMFSMVFLYMCMYLYIWKKPQHQHL